MTSKQNRITSKSNLTSKIGGHLFLLNYIIEKFPDSEVLYAEVE